MGEYNTCKFCRTPISSDRKYCDKECMRLHMSEQFKLQLKGQQVLTAQCAYCGKKFTVTNNRQKYLVRNGENVFCIGGNCQSKYKRSGKPMEGVVIERTETRRKPHIAHFTPHANFHPNSIQHNPL